MLYILCKYNKINIHFTLFEGIKMNELEMVQKQLDTGLYNIKVLAKLSGVSRAHINKIINNNPNNLAVVALAKFFKDIYHG